MKNLIYCDSFTKKRKEGNVMALTLGASSAASLRNMHYLSQTKSLMDKSLQGFQAESESSAQATTPEDLRPP